MHLELPVHASAPAQARREVASWLQQLCGLLPLCEVAEGLIFAMSEAVTNSIDHAFVEADTIRPDVQPPGPSATTGQACGQERLGLVILDGWVAKASASAKRHVVLTVVDDGRWRPPPTDPGNRGRGLAMMKGFVDQVDIDPKPEGTVVRLQQALEC
ncbi:hypothetical protein GCM10009836_04320 [Pseudonocardia ailaonensis]|uniref:Histidine kinase/HSP90-like ATPase domain-containing protein n=1 Tax=Pseudonocardia ailaonensis TaxID=367279 RepID=A0ABN2MMS3_9PSEU